MWKEKLGGLPIDLYPYQKKWEILPTLKGATGRHTTRRLSILEGNTTFKVNVIFEELFNETVINKFQVHLKDTHGTPTVWADLLEDIKTEYLRLSENGNTHYGRYQTIEPIFDYLLYKQLPKYPECEQRINPTHSEVIASENAAYMFLNADRCKTAKRLLSTRKLFYQVPYVQDLAFALVIFAFDKWQESFIIPDGCLLESNKKKFTESWLLEFLIKVMWQKGNALRERVTEEGLADKRGIYPCLVIYAIKTLEQEVNKKILKSDKVLSEIWSISPRTFKRRMSEFLSIDS